MFSQLGSMLLVCFLPVLPVGDEEGLPLVRNKPGQESIELRRYAIQPLVGPYTTPQLPIFGRIFGRRAWEKQRDDDRPRVWPLDGVRHGESARFLLPLPGQEPFPVWLHTMPLSKRITVNIYCPFKFVRAVKSIVALNSLVVGLKVLLTSIATVAGTEFLAVI